MKKRVHGRFQWVKLPTRGPLSGVDPVPPHPNPLPKEREPRSPYPGRNGVDVARTGDSSPSPWGEGWGEGDRSARLPTAYPQEPSRNHLFFQREGGRGEDENEKAETPHLRALLI